VDLVRAKALQIDVMTRLLDFELVPPKGRVAKTSYPRFRPKKSWVDRNPLGPQTRLRDIDPRRVISVGISLPSGAPAETGYGLLLLCQRKEDLNGPIATRIKHLAGSEVRQILTGPIRIGVTAPRPQRVQGGLALQKKLKIGDSVGRLADEPGTIGCFVKLTGKAGTYLLSNNHVLRGPAGQLLDKILSRAPADGGSDPADHVAALDAFHPIDLTPTGHNLVDCAVAKIRSGIAVDRNNVHGLPLAQGPVAISHQTKAPLVQEPVTKVGRTTQGTTGKITGVGLPIGVWMKTTGFSKQAFFSEQIFIEGTNGAFALPGDSGSVVFNSAMDAVGLVFATSQSGGRNGGGLAYANPMDLVLDAFDAIL
jgi:hypothetical protein